MITGNLLKIVQIVQIEGIINFENFLSENSQFSTLRLTVLQQHSRNAGK